VQHCVNYIPVRQYAQPGSALPNEIGNIEGVRFCFTRFLKPYAAAGTYPVTLTVSGPGGQSLDTAQAVVGSPQPTLVADVSLPKSAYTIGESITITLAVNRSAYVYLVEITADNRVVLLFPSLYEPNNALAAGARVLPGGAYTLRASEPAGAETLRLFAATGPIAGFPTSFGLGFPTLSTNPIAFVNTVLATMQSTFAAGDRAVDSVSLTVQSAPPTTGTLRVLSTPAGASVRLDGVSVGTTNLERPNVSPGTHMVEISRSGYQTETRQATITAGSTTTVQVTLTPTPVNQAPIAAFTYSPTSPGAGTPVQFDASSSADPDGTIISYAWNFGDTGTATGALVSHGYAANGSYTVQLTVTDNGGRTAQVSQLVAVSTPTALALSASLSKNQYELGETLVLTIDVNRAAYVYICDLSADGRLRLIFPNVWEPSPVMSAGTRQVPAPDSGYTLSVAEPVGNETLYFVAASGPISIFPTDLTGPFPTLSTNAATFWQSILDFLAAHYAPGDRTTASLTFVIQPSSNLPPVARFAEPYRVIPIGRGQLFRPSASGSYDPDGQIISYAWDFGDGETAGGALPIHSYRTAGTFTLRLTVTDNEGASTTIQTTVCTYDPLVSEPPATCP